MATPSPASAAIRRRSSLTSRVSVFEMSARYFSRMASSTDGTRPHPPHQASGIRPVPPGWDQYAALLLVIERVSGTEHPNTLANRAYWTPAGGQPGRTMKITRASWSRPLASDTTEGVPAPAAKTPA